MPIGQRVLGHKQIMAQASSMHQEDAHILKKINRVHMTQATHSLHAHTHTQMHIHTQFSFQVLFTTSRLIPPLTVRWATFEGSSLFPADCGDMLCTVSCHEERIDGLFHM